MDAKKKIRKYIALGDWITYFGFVLVGLGALSLLAGWFQGDTSGIYVAGCIFAAAFAMIFLAVGLPSFIHSRKCLKDLESRGLLELAARELDGPDVLVVGKKKGILTEHFLFGRNMGVAIPYEDICWCYKRRLRNNLIQIVDSLIVSTKETANLTAINFGRMDRKNALGEAVDWILKRNGQVLVGFTKENKKAYKAMAGKNKKK